MGVEADTSRQRLRRWRFGYGEIGYIVASPLRSVPPHPLLPVAPRLPGWIGRGTVVQQPPVGRPGEAPIQLRATLAGRIGLFTGGKVPVGSRKDTGVDPGRTCRRAVIGKGGETGEVLGVIVGVVSIQFLQE